MGSVVEAEPPFPLTDADRYILSITDEEYNFHDWDDLDKVISELADELAEASAKAAEADSCLGTPHNRDEQPVRLKAEAVRSAQVHEMDSRDKG